MGIDIVAIASVLASSHIYAVDSEVPLVSECDSGIGHSGRLSALSHHSDGAVINIPDGRESRDSR